MEGNKKSLELSLESDALDIYRVPEHVNSRALGFIQVLYDAGVVNTLGDLVSLREEQVYMVDHFRDRSMKSLNNVLMKYGLPKLEVDIRKGNLRVNRRRADMETIDITNKLGLERGYRLSAVYDFYYKPEKFYV
jgi:hypothetical protein